MKNNLGMISKKLVAFLAILTVIVYCAMPMAKVFANDAYTVTFTFAQGFSGEADDHGRIIVHDSNSNNIYTELRTDKNDNTTVTGSSSCNGTTCTIEVSDGATTYVSTGNIDLFAGGQPYNVDNPISGNITFNVQERPQGGGGEEPVGGEDDIAFNIHFTNTHIVASINGKSIIDDQDGIMRDSFEGTIQEAGTTDSNQTNTIRVQESFGEPLITGCTINNVDYTSQSENVTVDEFGAWVITVPGAASYTITGEGDQNAPVPRTIIWYNADANKDVAGFDDDMLLEHGKAKVIAVYDKNNHLVDPQQYIGNNSDQYGVGPDGYGWVTIEPESKVVFEFVPEYGYQLTSVSANGFALEAQDEINQYTYIMPDTNVHFSAQFKKTSDIVSAESTKVSSGTIKLGESLEGGSANLTIKDIELGSSKIKNFEKAAGDYKISNYLDIDLYNIFYKGKDDSDDVWSNKIEELDNEATITIKLEDGVDGNDIVIVHNIHDGEEFEVIPTTYDKETNTITFKTKSFSNYAIASKTTSKATSNIKTSDQIMIYVSLFGLSIVGIILISILKKRELNLR